MNALERQVLIFIREKEMMPKGCHVVAGISGGADSVCLLTVLHRLQRILKIDLEVVHVNHGIREKAKEDAAFVEKLCGELNVPCTVVVRDVPAIAKERGIGLEEAGRAVRYEAFGGAGSSTPSAGSGTAERRIATAHTADDSAETVLLNLFRGTGLKGAAGILPVNGEIVRPLLRTSRAEIEAYLKEEGIAWREDETNAEDAYARNRVRHHILPLAVKEINPQAVRHLAEAGETFAEAWEVVKDIGSPTIQVSALRREAHLVQQERVRAAIAKVSPQLKDVSRRHIDAVLHLCRNSYGVKELDLPHGIKAVRDHDTLFFCKNDKDLVE